VEKTVRRPRPTASLATLGAVGFLVAMAVSGRLPDVGSLVKFQPAGLMRETPEEVDRVEVSAEGWQRIFVRADPERWALAPSRAERPAPAPARLEMAVRFLHASAPIRVMEPGEYRDQAMSEFGLEPPRYTVRLLRQGRLLLGAHFGARNPQDVAQYVRVDGRSQLYLLPSFVGGEWDAVLEAVNAP